MTEEATASADPPERRQVSDPDEARFVAMLRAIGSPVRYEILKYLVLNPGCITRDIVNVLPVAQATVSQHLKVLRDAGWVDAEARGAATSYCLNKANIAWFKSRVAKMC
jgi:ArsR family transcriptional regulator